MYRTQRWRLVDWFIVPLRTRNTTTKPGYFHWYYVHAVYLQHFSRIEYIVDTYPAIVRNPERIIPLLLAKLNAPRIAS